MKLRDITIITGLKGKGKTALIKKLVKVFREHDYVLGGIYSPGVYQDGKKIGIKIIDLKNQEEKLLAEYDPGWDHDMPLREWRFINESINWGNEVIKYRATPCEILIIDEIGYLELEKSQGWFSVFDTLKKGQYIFAYIVIRKSLLDIARGIWKEARIVDITKIKNQNTFLHEELQRVKE